MFPPAACRGQACGSVATTLPCPAAGVVASGMPRLLLGKQRGPAQRSPAHKPALVPSEGAPDDDHTGGGGEARAVVARGEAALRRGLRCGSSASPPCSSAAPFRSGLSPWSWGVSLLDKEPWLASGPSSRPTSLPAPQFAALCTPWVPREPVEAQLLGTKT